MRGRSGAGWGGDGANEGGSAGRAGQGAGAGRGGGVVRGCGRAPVPLVFRAARWRRGGRGQQRRTSTGGHWRVALLGGDGADESSSAGRAGQGTGAGRGGAVVHGAAGARGMGGGGVGVVRGGVHVALLSSPVLVWCLLNKTGEGFSWRSTREKKIVKKAFDGCSSLVNVKFPSISKRLKNLFEAGYSEIQDEIDNTQHFEWNGDDLVVSTESMSEGYWCADWAVTKGHLDHVLSWVSYYELKEATTTIELAMWKAKIEETGAITHDRRNACRVDVPGPAKDAFLQYLNSGSP